MKNILLFIILSYCIHQSFQSGSTHENQLNSHSHSDGSTTQNMLKKNVKFLQIELNRVVEFQVVPGELYVTCIEHSLKQRINLNLYSSQVLFGFLYQQQVFSDIGSFSSKEQTISQKQFLKDSVTKFGQIIMKDQKLIDKMTQNKQYKHFMSFEPKTKNESDQNRIHSDIGIFKIAFFVPIDNLTTKNPIDSQQTFNITVIITKNTTIIKKQSFQKHIQYKLRSQQIQQFNVDVENVFSDSIAKGQTSENLSKEKLSDDIDDFFLFHNIHVVGDFEYNVSILVKKEGNLEFESKILVQIKSSESTYQFNKSLLQLYSNDQTQVLNSENVKKQVNAQSILQHTNIYVVFEVRCGSPMCVFIAEVEKSTEVRQVVPGIPYIYSINAFQIFLFKNPFDLDIFIDMSKKNGFPQYQICSSHPSSLKISISDNSCLTQLTNPSSGNYMFQVKQKDDKLHALGRNNQIAITPQHQSYCYKCWYFVALYTDYDNVMGMITFKNERAKVILPEGNSITKVLKRNLTDVYDVYGQESRLLFERFSGREEVYVEEIELEDLHEIVSIKVEKDYAEKRRISYRQQSEEDNYYSVDLRDFIEVERDFIEVESQSTRTQSLTQQIKSVQKTSNSNKLTRLSIKTEGNYPSTYYSLMSVNNESRKMILKDGVPFFNKQTNKVSLFKYLTQNLETQSFGTIIINSNQIAQIGLQIYGNCLTLEQTVDSIKQFKMEKEDASTLNTLKNRIKLSNSKKEKKYELQKIENKKINLMANRIDIIIEPSMCKSYLIKMVNNAASDKEQAKERGQKQSVSDKQQADERGQKQSVSQKSSVQQSQISYQILVSFIDSIILPLNNQVPGILQYPGKIIQIYQIFTPQKCTLSILINFCRSAKSRMQLYRNKQALLLQNSDHKTAFTSQSQLQEIIYQAHSGVFYVTIEFFGFGSILQYTLLVKQRQVEEGFYYVDFADDEQDVQYVVTEGRFFSTTYKLFFTPVFLKHWSKNLQRDVEYFQTKYFLLQSNSYPLLKRASNCKGQFFSDIVNHHEHFKQLPLQKNQLTFHPPTKASQQFRHQSSYSRGYYSLEYQTSNPLSFVIIVPVISRSAGGNQMSVIPYWQMDKKSRQPYKITQLYNGKVYSIFQHWFVSIVVWMEELVDFHVYQSFIVMLVAICSCMPVTCCVLLCVYRTKVNIQFYCDKIYAWVEGVIGRNNRIRQNREELQNIQEINRQESVAIPSEENQNLSDPNIELPQNNQDELQSDNSTQREEQEQRVINTIEENDHNFGLTPTRLHQRRSQHFSEQNSTENSAQHFRQII